MDISVAKESLPHIMGLLRAQKDSPEFRKSFMDGFFTEAGFKDFENMIEVYALVNIFIQEQKISCAEATVNDNVYENAPAFIESLAKVVGYFKYDNEQ